MRQNANHYGPPGSSSNNLELRISESRVCLTKQKLESAKQDWLGTYRFLLDTGHSRSIIRFSFIRDHEIIRVNGYTLKSACGKLLSRLGHIRLNFEIRT